jgi:integrase
MATMGRRRKSADHGLEPRVYQSHGAYFYVHRETGKWEPLGKDKDEANRKARIYNDPTDLYGTVVHWMDQFLIDCQARVKAGRLAQRTYEDYAHAILAPTEKKKTQGGLRTFFKPPMTPADVLPTHIEEYLAIGLETGRAVQANREKACFSAFMGWLIRRNEVPGLLVNPCLRGSGIHRNPESKRQRYVTHDEYREVFAVATRSERLLMELTYRTLQRPESDIIHWDTRNVITEGGRRKLDFIQNKTGRPHKIGMSPAMEELIAKPEGTVRKLREPLIKTLKGEHYTYDGLSSMLRRSIEVANERRRARGVEPMASFGFRDLKGKGATDMYYLAKVPLAEIQQLLGHANQTTTEIYIKARWRETAEPNMVVMA